MFHLYNSKLCLCILKRSGRTKYDDINGPPDHLCCHKWLVPPDSLCYNRCIKLIFFSAKFRRRLQIRVSNIRNLFYISFSITDSQTQGILAKNIRLRVNKMASKYVAMEMKTVIVSALVCTVATYHATELYILLLQRTDIATYIYV